MAYGVRTKDDPLDLGRAADQNQSVDNDAYLYTLLKYVEMVVVWWTSSCDVAEGAFYLHIPAELDGMDLKECHAEVITAGVEAEVVMTMRLHNLGKATDMLSTFLTIDSEETGSDTAATPYVIDSAKDDVAENDLLRLDIQTVHSTPAKGLIVTLGFGEA